MPRSYKPIQLIWNYTPVLKPMPAADLPAAVDEEPAVCVRLSNKLVPYLLGLLEMYRWEDKLSGTSQEIIDGLGLFQELMVALTEGNCTGDSMSFQLRQNPLNSCQLQQSLDGGQTWTLAFDYGQCGAGVLPNLTNTGTITPTTVYNTLQIALKNNPNANPYNFFPSDMKAVGIEITRGDCLAAGYVAELFVDFWNEAAQAEYEGTFSDATGIVQSVLTGIFVGGLVGASVVAKGTIVGIPVSAALDALAWAAPVAAQFYTNVTVGAFRAIYEALGGGATPPIHPLMVNEVKCALIEQLTAARTVANFQSISGALIPPEVADAWQAFATLEMWTLFNTMSVMVDKNENFCCGESCYAIPPAAMGVLQLTAGGVSWVSAEVVGQYLKSKNPPGLAAEAINAVTYYPFNQQTGNKIQHVRIVTDGLRNRYDGSGSQVTVEVTGITIDNQRHIFPQLEYFAGLMEYTITPQSYVQDVLYKAIEIYISCTLIPPSSTYKTIHEANYVLLRAVEVCLSD